VTAPFPRKINHQRICPLWLFVFKLPSINMNDFGGGLFWRLLSLCGLLWMFSAAILILKDFMFHGFGPHAVCLFLSFHFGKVRQVAPFSLNSESTVWSLLLYILFIYYQVFIL
jgi:hypothetical protein